MIFIPPLRSRAPRNFWTKTLQSWSARCVWPSRTPSPRSRTSARSRCWRPHTRSPWTPRTYWTPWIRHGCAPIWPSPTQPSHLSGGMALKTPTWQGGQWFHLLYQTWTEMENLVSESKSPICSIYSLSQLMLNSCTPRPVDGWTEPVQGYTFNFWNKLAISVNGPREPIEYKLRWLACTGHSP